MYTYLGGAQYDGSIQRWDKLELAAKKQKIGMWSQKTVKLPSEYKKETKEKVQKVICIYVYIYCCTPANKYLLPINV
jgi:hypothetical protein